MVKSLIYLGYGFCLLLLFVHFSLIGQYTILSQTPQILCTLSVLILLVKEHKKLGK